MSALDHLRAELVRLDRTLVETLRARLDTVADIVRVEAEGLPFLRSYPARTTSAGAVDRMHDGG